MIAISAKWVARPSQAPAAPHSVAAGNGPEATKRSMSAGALPRIRLRIAANKMSSVPATNVAQAIVRPMIVSP